MKVPTLAPSVMPANNYLTAWSRGELSPSDGDWRCCPAACDYVDPTLCSQASPDCPLSQGWYKCDCSSYPKICRYR
jgi:hypothetical protein